MGKKIKDDILWQKYRVPVGKRVCLTEWDTGDTAFAESKKNEKELMKKLQERLWELQELLYAEHKHKILVVLQAMDTAGKDSTIRHVFKGVNPQGVRVSAFKVPAEEELNHDYLWRVHQKMPAKGEIMIFNRSHYEDVLVVRVHDLVPDKVWQRRYAQINDFERMLAEEGTTIIKFFLHIDKKEQKKRLEERLADPRKQWKFSSGDLKERSLWPAYMKAYEDVLSKTSTSPAPWFIIPSNKKWYRNLLVSSIIVETLRNLNMKYPRAEVK